ncbi:MAG: vitamin K epoxide reductase family protein [Acidobacteria bacterium]|nr:vitamin K epoxide reductase family protein [Acidobacteriota bacterium]
MGRKAKARKEPPRNAPGAAHAVFGSTPNWPLLALSLIGVALAGYLSWTSWSGGSVQGCSTGSGCDLVLSSRWATLMGLPTAFWGLLTYFALAATAFLASAARQWRLAWTLSFFGVLYSAYLTTVSVTMLGATCPYCLTSLALMAAIFAVVTFQRPEGIPGFSWQRWLRIRGPVAVGIIAFLHLNYIGLVGKPPAVEDPTLRALAVHLAESGAKMYGADWCPHCQDQKALFGAAAKRLPYIECSMGARQGSPQTAECREARINTYPTWEIAGKRYEEVLSPLRLAELTGFDLAAATQPPAAPQ